LFTMSAVHIPTDKIIPLTCNEVYYFQHKVKLILLVKFSRE
jgi:hypothetical protein